MSQAALRAYFARENIDAPLTPEEQLLVAPPDVQEQDPEIATVIAEDQADDIEGVVEMAHDDQEQVQSIVDTLEEAGDEVTPTAVAVATESLNKIYRRYNLPVRKRISKEDINGMDAVQEVNDVIAEANENNEFIAGVAAEGIKESFDKFLVEARQFLKWRSTFAKEANAVATAAGSISGSPNDATWSNTARLSYITKKDKTQVTTADEMIEIIKTAAANTGTLIKLFDTVFKGGTKGAVVGGSDVDWDAAFKSVKLIGNKTKVDGKTIYEISSGLGGEVTLVGVPDTASTSSSNKTFKDNAKLLTFEREKFWSIGDIKGESLPVMSSKEIAAQAQKLATVGGVIESIYSELGDARDYFLVKVGIDTKLARLIIWNFISTARHEIDTAAKAMSCLLDYYKWSLKNHQQSEIAAEGWKGAVAGGIGLTVLGMTTFLSGGAVPLAVTIGLTTAIGIGATDRANALAHQIKDLDAKLAKAVYTDADLKEKISEKDLKTFKDASFGQRIKGALGASFFGGIYGAIKGSSIENMQNELKAKIEEFNKLVEEAAKKAEAGLSEKFDKVLESKAGATVKVVFKGSDDKDRVFVKWLSKGGRIDAAASEGAPEGFAPFGKTDEGDFIGLLKGKFVLFFVASKKVMHIDVEGEFAEEVKDLK